MLRNRLITVLTFNDGVLFRTKLFTPDYRYTHNFIDSWSVDEVIVLDVTAPEKRNRKNFEKVISEFARNCFVPLAAGGGIRTLDDAREFIGYGADKVVLNTGAFDRPDLISEVASLYGAQCAVLSIDARKIEGGDHEVFVGHGKRATGIAPEDWAAKGAALGAGEIMITSIDRDGSLAGYDLPLSRKVVDAVQVPVLISGGAGNWKHFVQGFKDGGASAVCTSNIYHFTETSIASAKAFLDKAGIPVRL